MKLKIFFTDFWPDFNPTNNFFWNILSGVYELELSKDPDILFFSLFGKENKKFNCLKIFFTGENYKPSIYDAHLSISYYKESERNIRYPLYLFYHNIRDLQYKREPEVIHNDKKKFCCFIVSNNSCKKRNDFFNKLSKYKKVDSGGKFLNNIGYRVEDKMSFIKEYKFIIAFENISFKGYTTEKILEAMLGECVPIYWGNKLIYEDFNTKSFINVHDFSNLNDVVEKIIQLDNDDNEYLKILKEPWLNNNTLSAQYQPEYVLNKIIKTYEYYKTNSDFAELSKQNLFSRIIDKMERKFNKERF